MNKLYTIFIKFSKAFRLVTAMRMQCPINTSTQKETVTICQTMVDERARNSEKEGKKDGTCGKTIRTVSRTLDSQGMEKSKK